jgi:hypothetical protein
MRIKADILTALFLLNAIPDLLDMKKTRSMTLAADLTKQFFGINKEQKIIRYSSQNLEMEVFITNDTSKVRDRFTHLCLSTENCENLTNKASSMGFTVIKIILKNEFGFE